MTQMNSGKRQAPEDQHAGLGDQKGQRGRGGLSALGRRDGSLPATCPRDRGQEVAVKSHTPLQLKVTSVGVNCKNL